MKLFKLLGGVLAAATLFVAPALAGPPNALDAYVAKPEPSYNVRVAGSCKGETM